LVPNALNTRPETIEKRIAVTTSAEDELFISSTRTIIYNYIIKKVKNSDKWNSVITQYTSSLPALESKTFLRPHILEFHEEEQPLEETNLFELLRQQAKKKVHKK
jgi:hypothetical protein